MAASNGNSLYCKELDGLRGIAMLLVAVHHATLIQPITLWCAWLVRGLHLGWVGVDLFFVLSGFLITRILWGARGSAGALPAFIARRVLRIVPLYYLLLLAGFHIAPRFVDLGEVFAATKENELWFWLYLQNYSSSFNDSWPHSFFGITWSLAVEEQFYLAWPAVVLGMTRRKVVMLCWAVIIASPLIRAVACAIGWTEVHVFTFPFGHADGLAMGSAVAMAAFPGADGAVHKGAEEPARPCRRRAYFLAASCLAGSGLWIWSGGPEWGGGITVASAIFALVVQHLAVGRRRSLLRRACSGQLVQWIGKRSYAMYLTHMPIISCTRRGLSAIGLDPFGPEGSVFGQLALYGIAGSGTALAAIVCWRMIEAPCLALKERWPMPQARSEEPENCLQNDHSGKSVLASLAATPVARPERQLSTIELTENHSGRPFDRANDA